MTGIECFGLVLLAFTPHFIIIAATLYEGNKIEKEYQRIKAEYDKQNEFWNKKEK